MAVVAAFDTLITSCKYKGTVTFKNKHILIYADLTHCKYS